MDTQKLNKWNFYKDVWYPGTGLPMLQESLNFFAGNPAEWAKIESWQDSGTNSTNDRFARAYQAYSTSYDQQLQIKGLQAQAQERQAAVAEQLKIKQTEIPLIEAANQAAATSLRILTMQPKAKAPTAAVSLASAKKAPAGARSGGASLRIGATSTAQGAGLNIGG